MDETSDSPRLSRPKSMPPIVANGMETPPPPVSARPRPVSSGLHMQSIKTRLRIPPVNVKDFANYLKGKRQTTDLRVEWEVSKAGWCDVTSISVDVPMFEAS